ncbi:MAG TPA: NADH:flavin oxidoreductase/NADH oxidase, partial [Bryobacteraceae bacterium]|nr:NADH:flavin oxidoreductase/NADH oxidase [Bryobacteraceae bacterium]
SAADGLMNDWHFAHLAARATGGAGIVFTESVHTEPRGRISSHCLGLWNDQQRDAMKRVVEFIASQEAVPAIQLGHAGRKTSVTRPWEGSRPIPKEEGGWVGISSTDRPFAAGWPAPIRMTKEMIGRAAEDFALSVRRAREAGYRILEIHAAHGYLIHQFLSPLSNDREDEYGGSFENRVRMLLETIAAARAEWPADLPMFVRISCTDWVEGGWTLEDSIALCRILAAKGDVDLIDCSSGGNDPRQQIPIHPGYQTPFAAAIKSQTGLRTGAVGLIHSPDLAESIIANGQADLVVLGRALLADPVWPLRAASHLKAAGVKWPVQYERSNIF